MVRRQRRSGECEQEQLLLFPQERTGEAGEAGEAGSGLGGLNNLSGLWSTGAVPRCLVPGCGVLLLRKKGRTDGNQLCLSIHLLGSQRISHSVSRPSSRRVLNQSHTR